MRPVLLTLLMLLLLLCGSAHAQTISRACDAATYFKHEIPTGPVVVVTGEEGKRIYFCGFMVTQKGNTLDLIVTVGKGDACQINTIQITPQLELPNDFALTNRIDYGQPIGEPGASLCIQTLGAGKLTGVFYFTKF